MALLGMIETRRQIWIVGTVCIGKTVLAHKISEEINYPLLNENNSGGLEGLISKIPQTASAVIEHCWLVNSVALPWPNCPDTKDIIKVLESLNLLIIFVRAHHEILLRNKQKRLNAGVGGGYRETDPVEMQNRIEQGIRKFCAFGCDKEIVVYKIKKHSDYNIITKKCVEISRAFSARSLICRKIFYQPK